MSSQGLPTLDLDVRSRCLEPFVAVIAILSASAAPWVMQRLDARLLAAFSLAAGLALAFGFWQAGWLGAGHRLVRLVWLADGRWFLTNQQGQCFEATLRSDSRRGAQCVWLRWDGQVRYSMLLGRSDLAPGQLRRLLVRLSIDRGAGLSLQLLDDDVEFDSAHPMLRALRRLRLFRLRIPARVASTHHAPDVGVGAAAGGPLPPVRRR